MTKLKISLGILLSVLFFPSHALASKHPSVPESLEDIKNELNEMKLILNKNSLLLDRITEPDILPINSPEFGEGPNSFCKLNEETGDLIVMVINNGLTSTNVPTTEMLTTIVIFRNSTPDSGDDMLVEFPTPSLGSLDPGEIVEFNVEIPSECFAPDCHFKIIVDPHDVVIEADESNNRTLGFCLG